MLDTIYNIVYIKYIAETQTAKTKENEMTKMESLAGKMKNRIQYLAEKHGYQAWALSANRLGFSFYTTDLAPWGDLPELAATCTELVADEDDVELDPFLSLGQKFYFLRFCGQR